MILPGNASCQGCPISIVMRCLDEISNPVLAIPASCSTVIAGLHPKSAMKVPVVHVPFPSTLAVAAGLSEAYKRLGVKANVVAWIGDGAADIGFAALSASAARKDDLITIVVDNEAYMNTGTQASLSTFWKAKTTTSPTGKTEERRNLALIMLAHKADYVATASVGYIKDLRRKFRRAEEMKGFRFLQIHTPCPPGWKFPSEKTVEVARKAVMSGAWILWEYDGKLRLSKAGEKYALKENRIPLEDYLKQGRFSHLSDEEIRELEQKIDEDWELLLRFS
ncbi:MULTISPECIES: thiamine pyrophosphate-dependent enzyme [unclassified Archaeoglobus]|jgi:pyruvate ferredoxin oxidoreductase beta subunit|uniref:thiamine pyrophosphate-dependent enzyme n=1 Tax=unclassified Archaeoglobus TaxID=2643606 RepID=UPI0025BBD6D4|nr:MULTISPECIES: thiamine pyrophosphate-dependent enzyme [unclassified Archaeoglobus]